MQHPLSQFYHKVKSHNPTMAVLISEDLLLIALGALATEHEAVEESVERLRHKTNSLSEDLIVIREDALSELGYL